MASKKKKDNILKIILILFFVILTNLLILVVKYSNKTDTNGIIVTKVKEILSKEPTLKGLNKEELKNKQENAIKIILEIPKIRLKQELVNKEAVDNDVNKNILTVAETTYPEENGSSHLILAAHSGYGNVAFFKNLTELVNNDEVIFYYNNKKYVYNIVNSYEIEKTGKMVFKAVSSNDVTLITCLKGQNKQIVYQGTLSFTSNYS